MAARVVEAGRGRLERLCGRIRIGRGAEGIERMEAAFRGQAYALHRHDTYGIGITLAGVQIFRYRGERRQCLAGECHILHPDELHDGGAGTEQGFRYRILYVDPALIQEALGGRPLPFVRAPVVAAGALPRGFAAEAWDLEAEVDECARVEIAAAAASLLLAASGGTARPAGLAVAGVRRVRDLIAAGPAERHTLAALERVAGVDRWTLARQFRVLFGTSPTRFRTLRRLDTVRRRLRDGVPLAEAALEAGFADQSHMTRQFKRAYGLTPAAWASASG
jgi:AraC-like DNA-binding protein